jgi:microcystin-dependent protein
MSVAGSANADVPIGVVLPYGGFIAPKGGWWLLCDGSVFDPVKYSALYSIIGTQFGGTANAPLLPDMRGRYGLGYTAGVNSIGEKIAPTLSGTQSFTLTASDIPSLDPIDGNPSFTVSITQPVYQQQADPFTNASAFTDPIAYATPTNNGTNQIQYVTTITGANITYTSEVVSPTPVTSTITATSIAYSGYDMTFIIKAKGF